jgi:hypothetical protein
MNASKYILCLMLSFAYQINANSQTSSNEKNIELLCSGGEKDVREVLFFLSVKTNNFTQNYTIETLREVYAEAMSMSKEKLTAISQKLKMKNDSGFVDLVLGSVEINYKYGLCQKYMRNEAAINTLAKEAYFLCRKTIVEKIEQRPPPCF